MSTLNAQENEAFMPEGSCPKCFYPMDPGRCPECGLLVPPSLLVRRPAKTELVAWQIDRRVLLIVLGGMLLWIGVCAIVPNVCMPSGPAQIAIANASVGPKGILHSALRRYALDMGAPPTFNEGLGVLFERPLGAGKRWLGPYLEGPFDELRDPWGQPYRYEIPGQNGSLYGVCSSGPDGVPDAGANDDICGWRY